MLKKQWIFLLLLLLLAACMLFANESEDLQFVVKLYANGEYRIAKLEIDKFLAAYPESRFVNDVSYLKADILLRDKRYDASREIFQKLYNGNVKSSIRAEVILGLAQCCYFMEDYTRAKELFQQFTSQFPQHEQNWLSFYYQGRIAYLKKTYRESSDLLASALRFKDDPKIYPALIQSMLKSGKAAEAEEMLTILENMPGAQSYIEQARIFYLQNMIDEGQYKAVLTYNKEAISPDSQYYDAYAKIIATAFFETGDYRQAMEMLQTIEKLDDSAEYYLALAYMNLEQIDKARPLFEKLAKDSSQSNIKANSQFYLAKIQGQSSLDTANQTLESFIASHPESSFISAARFQLGMNCFEQKSYLKANENFKKALSELLDNNSREKARFMIAETNFLLNKPDDALTAFTNYLTSYPNGKFRDEALFKAGLIRFQKRDFRQAKTDFERLLADESDSGKNGMANFYLGEIALNMAQDDQALLYFQKSLSTGDDIPLVHERIARIYFHKKDYDQALASLRNIQSGSGIEFSKALLTGDIYFAMKSYRDAQIQYQNATDSASDETEREQARSRLAWTYYQLRDYSKATSLYNDLSASSADRSKFLLMAANAAFSADDFVSAADYFKQYLQGSPSGEDKYKAILGIADSYYNLGDYKNASSYYSQLIYPYVPKAWFDNALDGIKWCGNRSDQIDFVREIDNLLNRDGGDSFKGKLLEAKANSLTEEGRYAEAILTCETIINDHFGYTNLNGVRLLLAKCYTETGKYRDAEKVYTAISTSSGKNEELLYSWAQLKQKENDNIAAIVKLTEASKISHDARIWLDLLRLQQTEKHPAFMRTYDDFMQFTTGLNREKAELLWIQYQIGSESSEMIEPVIENLLKSQHKEIRASAQYWKGYVLYNKKQYEEAISELLRVRYLYPEIEDVKIQAEYLACFAYVDIREEAKARERYEMIKEFLTPQQRQELAKKLGGE